MPINQYFNKYPIFLIPINWGSTCYFLHVKLVCEVVCLRVISCIKWRRLGKHHPVPAWWGVGGLENLKKLQKGDVTCWLGKMGGGGRAEGDLQRSKGVRSVETIFSGALLLFAMIWFTQKVTIDHSIFKLVCKTKIQKRNTISCFVMQWSKKWLRWSKNRDEDIN